MRSKMRFMHEHTDSRDIIAGDFSLRNWRDSRHPIFTKRALLTRRSRIYRTEFARDKGILHFYYSIRVSRFDTIVNRTSLRRGSARAIWRPSENTIAVSHGVHAQILEYQSCHGSVIDFCSDVKTMFEISVTDVGSGL
jgi:hypothetical protein